MPNLFICLTPLQALIAQALIRQTAHPADDTLCGSLKNGVLLHDDNETVAAQEAVLQTPTTLLLTITEGKYHQVKRMIAAAGNRVAQLHRQQFGAWDTQDLAAGEWRFIQPDNA